jgi:hypothetical protein
MACLTITANCTSSNVLISQGTQACTIYEKWIDGDKFTIIDTPGFKESMSENLGVLQSVGRQLNRLRSSNVNVNACLYFYRITDGRMTANHKNRLETFKLMCGKHFFPHVAFATTQWDVVGPNGLRRYNAVHDELKRTYFSLDQPRPHVFKFENDEKVKETSSLELVQQLKSLKASTATMLFVRELERAGWNVSSIVRKTSAGKEEASHKSGRNPSCQIL